MCKFFHPIHVLNFALVNRNSFEHPNCGCQNKTNMNALTAVIQSLKHLICAPKNLSKIMIWIRNNQTHQKSKGDNQQLATCKEENAKPLSSLSCTSATKMENGSWTSWFLKQKNKQKIVPNIGVCIRSVDYLPTNRLPFLNNIIAWLFGRRIFDVNA